MQEVNVSTYKVFVTLYYFDDLPNLSCYQIYLRCNTTNVECLICQACWIIINILIIYTNILLLFIIVSQIGVFKILFFLEFTLKGTMVEARALMAKNIIRKQFTFRWYCFHKAAIDCGAHTHLHSLLKGNAHIFGAAIKQPIYFECPQCTKKHM